MPVGRVAAVSDDFSTLFYDVTARLMTGIHEGVFRASRGRALSTLMGMPVVLVTTHGRQTGEARSVMLTAPIADEHRIVLVASNGGSDRHPGWFHNLLADPNVVVLGDGREQQMRARVVEGDERAALWPEVVDRYPGYAWYQGHTDRQVPLVVLDG